LTETIKFHFSDGKSIFIFGLGSCIDIPLSQMFSLGIGLDSKEKSGKEILL
jgi:hypothetical protein